MKAIKVFETQSAYNSAKNGMVTPHVAYARSENKVFYGPRTS